MTYGQALIALDTGETVIASVAGCDIPVIVAAVSTRREVYHDRGVNRLVGDKYTAVECRGVEDHCVYHMRPEELTMLKEHDDKKITAIMGG